jgi:predicted amidophosphoribosyltransferase
MAYDGPARALVVALKEHGALPAARVMAAQIAATAPPGVLAGGVLVPAPADPLRRRRRGLDHAGRLAAELAERSGLPLAPALGRRPTRAGRQAGASRRLRLVEGRLPVEVRARSVPWSAILVDDVHTTGATLDACARALSARGTTVLAAVTYARTL